MFGTAACFSFRLASLHSLQDCPHLRELMMSKLFTAQKVGPLTLSHRVVHAPMTRLRSDPDDTPSDMMVEYYRQRASEGGLIITESAHTMRSGRGYIGGPGIYEEQHIAGWRKIADAVHAKGGRIFMQLGHDGRQSHVDLTGGAAPIAPSEVPFEGEALTHNGWVPVMRQRFAFERHLGWCDRRRSACQVDVRLAPVVSQLHEDAAALRMDGVRDFS